MSNDLLSSSLTLTPELDSVDAESPLPSRYQLRVRLGAGGMGEVWRARDSVLDRDVALKVIRPDLMGNRGMVARFLEEARATARLQHPGIIPVYDLGELADGRVFFTMKEIHGSTLAELIGDVHAASPLDRFAPSRSGWTFTRLIDAFRRVCEAVAHAHAMGVVHRDLKPDNVMAGSHGEVLVLDWGIAGALTAEEATHRRVVTGTPAYMSPEQASGELWRVGARSDVYALGAVLYEVLWGIPPYVGADAREVLALVIAGPPNAEPAPTPRVPEELAVLAAWAMARAPDSRPADAAVLAAGVLAWQEGAKKREGALARVAEAAATRPAVEAARRAARDARREAVRASDRVRAWEPIERKRAVWAAEDEADRRDQDLHALEHHVERLLQGALAHVPDLPEAHAALADLHRARHAEAEARRDRAAATRWEALVRDHDLSGAHGAWLRGVGSVSVQVDTPAHALLFRYDERDRRLEPVFVRELGPTPIRKVPVPMGSWMIELAAPGREVVRWPFAVGRAEHVEVIGPGGPAPIVLPALGLLRDDEIYVPVGEFLGGGDPSAGTGAPRFRGATDGFVMRRHPITNAEWIRFLDALVDAGREDEALRHAPRERGRTDGGLVYGRDARGHFTLVVDADGDTWQADWPVLLVDRHDAEAYAAWWSSVDGHAWRLPTEAEWEKAARGADGRFFPWGDHFDASWACLRESHRARPLPSSILAYPDDVGPFGVRGCAGNASDWCLGPDGESVARGGAWSLVMRHGRLAQRRVVDASYRSETISVRLVRDLG